MSLRLIEVNKLTVVSVTLLLASVFPSTYSPEGCGLIVTILPVISVLALPLISGPDPSSIETLYDTSLTSDMVPEFE